ncbi:glycoside hydrolase family 32 protein [Flavobacterium sp.]|uniref:glycoside hydrolase family 32 protein n=1 Tax=Flavobacterium sp. TaxID=239 RepID=UPI00286F3E4A|nr:glycoside hydrolase family 32 protein [Flavobacterium sp.]
MNLKNKIKFFISTFLLSLFLGLYSCESNDDKTIPKPVLPKPNPEPTVKNLQCTPQIEQSDYSIYKLGSDAKRIGDLMPIYDAASNKFYLYYLKDVWDDNSNQRHPWYALSTTDFSSYKEISSEIVSSSSDRCDQDFAIGSGSVIVKDNKYYAFYTAHNPNFPSSCVNTKEGIMLATSSNPEAGFTKNKLFTTIYAPKGLQFDEQDNFRDPYVFEDGGTYYMLVSARAKIGGVFKGVISYYTSKDLLSWSYDGIFYDGGTKTYTVMETPQVFKMGSMYYLIFSDIDSRKVTYRKSSSAIGPWSRPVDSEFLDGKDFYAAKAVTDGKDAFIMGWTARTENNLDSGVKTWGGNLVVHKLKQNSNTDLMLTIPDAVSKGIQTNVTLELNRKIGVFEKTDVNKESYKLTSSSLNNITAVFYEPIDAPRYLISTTVSYSNSNKDFGFFLGACDENNNVISLRFIPSENKISLDKKPRSSLSGTTISDNETFFKFEPNVDYDVKVVIENSIVVIYVNNQVALSSRVYGATNTSWGVFADNSSVFFKTITVTKP